MENDVHAMEKVICSSSSPKLHLALPKFVMTPAPTNPNLLEKNIFVRMCVHVALLSKLK